MVLIIKPNQVGRVNRLVRKLCCNYDEGDCLLLDDGDSHPCVQLLCVTGITCKYFKGAVLPAEKELYEEIIRYNDCR